jgi:hypothetical protein
MAKNTKIENVMLYDPYPSSISVSERDRDRDVVILVVLGIYGNQRGTLEYCGKDLTRRYISLSFSSNHNLVAESLPEDAIQLGEEGLPMNFKSKRIVFPTKRRTKNKIKTMAFSESRSEHNIYMGYNQSDSLFYPCRVVGLGPHFQTNAETAIVYFLGYGNFSEVWNLKLIIDLR